MNWQGRDERLRNGGRRVGYQLVGWERRHHVERDYQVTVNLQ